MYNLPGMQHRSAIQNATSELQRQSYSKAAKGSAASYASSTCSSGATMRFIPLIRRFTSSVASMSACRLAALCATVAGAVAGCAPASRSSIPPAPIVFHWPDPAFLPERQCRGEYAAEDVEYYLPSARLALSLPSTRSVGPDPAGRCIKVIVESIGGGRLAELVLRGAAVPRRAVLLTLASSERPRR
jgi:hypothetical protein